MSDDERMGDYEGGAGYDFDAEDPDHIEWVFACGPWIHGPPANNINNIC